MKSSAQIPSEELESRMYEAAQRNGFVLEKSPGRDQRAKDFGRFRLLVDHRDIEDHRATTPFEKSLQDVADFLLPLEDEDED